MPKAYILHFHSPYQVKYRGMSSRSEKIIDSSIVARSIVYALSLLDRGYAEELVRAVESDEVRFSSILPILNRGNGGVEPLIPFPHYLKIKLIEKMVKGDLKEVKKIQWATIDSVVELGGALREDSECRVEVGGEYARIIVGDREFKASNNIMFREGIIVPEKLFSEIRYIRNRIDRITNAADPYHQEAVLPLTHQYLLVECSENNICDLISTGLRLLSDIGIGSKRSAGLGEFKLLEDNTLNTSITEKFSKITSGDKGFWVSLGRFIPFNDDVDLDGSYYSIERVAGISGGYNPYKLPYVEVLGMGSTIKTKSSKRPRGLTITLTIDGRKSIISYNPLFYNIKVSES